MAKPSIRGLYLARLTAVVCLSVGFLTLVAQPMDGLVAYYSFDQCDATEDTGSGANGIIMGNADCGCGVSGNGLMFDGNTSVQILGNLDIIFANDFTLSFFVLPMPQGNAIMDILSKSETCGIDSTAEVKYNPVTREMSMSLSQHALNNVKNTNRLPANRCFHHIAYVRRNRELLMYYDGVLQSSSPSVSVVSIVNDGILTLGAGPCLANGEVHFRGVLDELRMYNRALTTSEVQELYLPVDRITSPDTVIFSGSSMQVRLPISCATTFQWTPAGGVTSPGDQQPILAPAVSTVYQVSMNYGFCQSSDEIRVTVADSTDLDCDKVFFPSGFTPNNDGLNDDWGMSNIVFLGDFVSLAVYDRWGGEVFSTTDPLMRWDGTAPGGEVIMPGLYIWQFVYRCGENERRKSGGVTVIR
jgi:gliding motility-associated-like protein